MLKLNPKAIPLIQYVLFAILVVMTPFVVVTKYLQGAVHDVSHLKWSLLGLEIPIIGSLAIIAFIAFLVWQRHNFTRSRIVAAGFILLMILLAYWVQDLYADMSLYDLQRNWHYIAYAAYVFMFFRAFHIRGVSKAKMVLLSFISAIGLSTFDEFFQLFMSHRCFDVSDIAKDSWGTMMGLILVLFVSETYGKIDLARNSIRQKKLTDYFRHPLSALAVTGSLSFSSLMISPLLTEQEYVTAFILITVMLFVLILGVIHISQFKPLRIALVIIAVIIVLGAGTSFFINKGEGITYNTYSLTVYNGIPIPFFDVIIYPNGLPRLTDKKHFFNNMDKDYFMSNEIPILLIGTGSIGKGGEGFNIRDGTYFVYNKFRQSGTQMIIMRTAEACRVYNRLIKSGKKVMFVLHNSC